MRDANTLNLIEDHFKWVAEELHYLARQAGILTNPSGIGTEREEVYRRFLKRHVPKMCDVFLGGYVFDLQGKRSKQTDIIVTGGNTPRFRLSGRSRFIAPLEGTIAVAEVKSRLDKNSLQEALENCMAIPPMPGPESALPSFLSYEKEAWEDRPFKVIFAFDGIERDSVAEHLGNFLKANRDRPTYRLPNIIHVLGKYTFRKIHTSQIRGSSSDKVIPDITGAYHGFLKNADVLAMMEILDAIHQGAFASNFLLNDYSEWYFRIRNRLEDE